MKFPCTMCGSCCKRIDKLVADAPLTSRLFGLPIEMFDFPYKWDENGVCEKLTEDGLCSIYENRPDICNLETVQQTLKWKSKMFFDITAASCNSMMKEDGIDEEFYILEEYYDPK